MPDAEGRTDPQEESPDEATETDPSPSDASDGTDADARDTDVQEAPAGPVRRRPSVGVLVALAVAVLFGASGVLAWVSAERSDDLAEARTRDAVLVAAKQHIATLNTLDYRSVGRGLKSWTAVTTGTLKDQFASVSASDQKLLADQKKVSTGKVVDAAVLDVDGGSAQVIASVEVEVRDGTDLSKEPTVKRNRFSAELTRVGGEWKLATLQQVAVDLS